jgi:hypothetical protein
VPSRVEGNSSKAVELISLKITFSILRGQVKLGHFID